MTSENPPSGATPPGGKGRRRLPTIDLTATEIEVTQSAPSPSAEPAVKAADAPPTAPAHATEAGPPELQPQPAASPDRAPDAEPATAAPSPSMEAPRTEATSEAAGASSDGSSGAAPRRGAWLPLGAGVVGGAVVLIGLGIAGLVTGRDTVGALDGRLAQLEQQLRDVAARPLPAGTDAKAIDDLASRLAKLEAAVATARPAAIDPALANRISAIEGQVKALGETVGILGRRSDEAVATAREARQRAEATAAALAELAQKVAQPVRPTVERSEFDALANRVAELAKRPAAESGDRSSRLAVAAAALGNAVERGAPFAAELATAKSLAGDPKLLAPLDAFASAGVPTAAALARQLAALAPSLQQAAGSPPRDGGFLEKLATNAEKLVRIRPLDEIAGSDPAAIVARVEVKAARADLAGALAELAKLPDAARAPAEGWIKQAQARAAAIEASRRLAADALSGLSK